MSDETRYTEDTVQRVGAWVPVGSPSARLGVARNILTMLADTGLLTPPGGETREELRDHPDVEVVRNAWVDDAVETWREPLKQHRTVTVFPDGSTLTGPWAEVTE